MNINTKDLSPTSHNGGHNVDTGFPEPLSPHRNTTLRHPDANTSKDAAIEAKDVPLSRAQSRVRIPGLHRKTQSTSTTISKSDFDVKAGDHLYDGVQMANGSSVAKTETQESKELNGAAHKDMNGDAYSGMNGDDNGHKHGERRNWLFRKSWHKA